jgi:hypothetical protein
MFESFRGLRKISRHMKHLGFGYSSRQGAKAPSSKGKEVPVLRGSVTCEKIFSTDI